MEMESEIIQMLSNRIEEASSLATKALEENYKTRDLCSERKYELVAFMLLVLHDRLLIVADTLHLIKKFVPHFTLKGNVDEGGVHHTQPIIR